MSNLYKQYFVARQSEKTRVIDSNEVVEKRLAELKKREAAAAAGAGGFVEGLVAPVVEVEPDDEPEIDYVEEAKAKAEGILSEAKGRSEAMIEEAQGQAQQIRDTAREEGYQSGYNEGRQRASKELEEKKAELEQERLRQQKQYDEQLADMEPQLLDVIIRVVEKVFHIQFDDKKDILLYLIGNAISGIEGCRSFQIRVGADNYQFMNAHKAEIVDRIGEDVSIEVIADNLIAEDKCMLETDVGVFDCSLSVQLCVPCVHEGEKSDI